MLPSLERLPLYPAPDTTVSKVDPSSPEPDPTDLSNPEVDVQKKNVSVRCLRMVLSAILWHPYLETRVLTFGRRVAFLKSPDSVCILLNDGSVLLSDLNMSQHRGFAAPVRKGNCICAVGREAIALGTNTGPIIIRKKADESKFMEYDQHDGPVDCMSFHPSGQSLVTAGPTSPGFFVWDYASRSARQVTSGVNRVTALAYSKCGDFVAAVSDSRWILVYYTYNWSCVQYGAPGYDDVVQSFAWAAPNQERSELMLALSGRPHLELHEVNIVDDQVSMQHIPLPATSTHLSVPMPGRSVLCAKELVWDAYGRRLAVLLDRPHPKAGSVALFRTHLTHEPQFLSYIPIIVTSPNHGLFVSMDWTYDSVQKAVKFAVYHQGRVYHFSSPFKQWELMEMTGPAYGQINR